MARTKSWYIVTGRRDGDDEDTTLVVKAYHSTSAKAQFWGRIAGDDSAVERYINTVIRCPGGKPVIVEQNV